MNGQHFTIKESSLKSFDIKSELSLMRGHKALRVKMKLRHPKYCNRQVYAKSEGNETRQETSLHLVVCYSDAILNHLLFKMSETQQSTRMMNWIAMLRI
jgi:hypothetical protein